MRPVRFWILLAVTNCGVILTASSLVALLLHQRPAADWLFYGGAALTIGGALTYCGLDLWEDRPWRH